MCADGVEIESRDEEEKKRRDGVDRGNERAGFLLE